MGSGEVKGKINPSKLKNLVFPYLGAKNSSVVIGPKIGEDAAVIDLDDIYLAVSSDPITGAKDRIGFYSVHINANDVATMGAVPQYFLPVIMLKENSGEDDVKTIMKDIDSTCKKLNISVIGGHSEVTPNLKEHIVSASVLGTISKDKPVISSSGAAAGDVILLTKGAGIEGTSILARDYYDELKKTVDAGMLKRARMYMDRISVVKEALIAREYATAMHDPTEGGVLGGVHEICDASEKGFYVGSSTIPVNEETQAICDVLDINPLALIGSGALLITCSEQDAPTLIKELEKNEIPSAIIGEIREDSSDRNLSRVEEDEIWRFV